MTSKIYTQKMPVSSSTWSPEALLLLTVAAIAGWTAQGKERENVP